MPVPMSVMQAAAQGDKKAMRLVEQEYGVGDGRRYAENWLSEEEPPPRVPGYIDHPESKEGDPDTENIVLDVPYFGSRNVIGLEHPVPPYTPEGEYGKLTSLNKLDPMTYFYGGQTQQPYYWKAERRHAKHRMKGPAGRPGGRDRVYMKGLPDAEVNRQAVEKRREEIRQFEKKLAQGEKYEGQLEGVALQMYNEYKKLGFSPTYYKIK